MKPTVRYADNDIVVVDKPAGLTTVRHGYEAAEFGRRAQRYLPKTLADILPGLLSQDRRGGKRRGGSKKSNSSSAPARVRAVHRLDKDTSGLVVFARNPKAERNLGEQFRAHR